MTNIRPEQLRYVSNIPIADYCIERGAGRDFTVLVRRRAGASVVSIIFIVAFAVAWCGLFFLRHDPLHPSQTGAPSWNAITTILIPLVAVAYWHIILGEIALFKGLGGKERWLITQEQIVPPTHVMGIQIPPLQTSMGLETDLEVIGGKCVLEFSSGSRSLYLGPFRSRALALRCEADLRRFRPSWFAESAGLAIVNGAFGETRINGFSVPPEPFIAVESVTIDDGCLLRLRREHGPRRWIGFLALYLTVFAGFEFLISWILLHQIIGIPGPGSSRSRGNGDLSILGAFVFCTIVGSLASGALTLAIKRTETWKFTNTKIIAGRSWHYLSKRRLPIEETIQVRFGSFGDPPAVDFISGGLLLHLGPFATWELAGEAMGDVEKCFPNWQWPSVPESSA